MAPVEGGSDQQPAYVQSVPEGVVGITRAADVVDEGTGGGADIERVVRGSETVVEASSGEKEGGADLLTERAPEPPERRAPQQPRQQSYQTRERVGEIKETCSGQDDAERR